MFRLFVFISGFFLSITNIYASFDTPKILSQTKDFYYHKISSNQKSKQTPSVIILGGGPGFSSWNLQPLQQKIAQFGYTTYLMDMVGIGENRFTRPGKSDTDLIDQWIKQINQLKTEVSDLKQVILVAHSWGALMAMLYTREHPKAVKKLVLLNPVDPQKKAMQNLTDEIDKRNNQENQIVWDNESAWNNTTVINSEDIKQITLRQIQQVLPTYFLNYDQGKKYAQQFTVNDFNIDINIQAWQEYDANPITFSQINAWQKPIYFLDCQQDYLMPYNLKAMQPNIRFSSVNVIQKCGHFPWIEQPKTFYAQLKKYLSAPS